MLLQPGGRRGGAPARRRTHAQVVRPRANRCPTSTLRDRIRIEHGRLPSAIRISVGVATNFADAYRFLCFLQGFVDRSVAEIDQPAFAAGPVTPSARRRDLHL